MDVVVMAQPWWISCAHMCMGDFIDNLWDASSRQVRI